MLLAFPLPEIRDTPLVDRIEPPPPSPRKYTKESTRPHYYCTTSPPPPPAFPPVTAIYHYAVAFLLHNAQTAVLKSTFLAKQRQVVRSSGVLHATARTRCLRYDNRGYACGFSLTAETGAAPSAPSSNECGSPSSATSSSGVPDVIPARILLHKRSTQLTYHSSLKSFKRERHNQNFASQRLHGTAALKPTATQNQPKTGSFL